MKATRPRTVRYYLAMTLTCAAIVAAAAREPALAGATQAERTFAQSLEEWITLLEKDDVATAAKRWARDTKAADAMRQHWSRLKDCHREYDYRSWLEKHPGTGDPGARHVGDPTRFTVGGHDYGHLHVVWEKDDAGWRIGGVWECR
jgi:hypothetical protein